MQKRLNPIHAHVDCTPSSLTSVPGILLLVVHVAVVN